MCGGIAAALSLGGQTRPSLTLAYHGGRITSYGALGALLGFLAGSINLAAWTLGLRYLAGVLLILMGLYIADWWRGLTVVERAGAVLWRPVQRFSSRFLPVTSPGQGFALGLGWGLMPCGLIYSGLAWAATAQSAWGAGSLMLAFGAGTLPAMLATSFGAGGVQALLRRRGLKVLIALLLILSGIWTLYLVASHGGHLLQRSLPVPGETPASMPMESAPMEGHTHHG
jgi:sulfite exporter TauE/SafE